MFVATTGQRRRALCFVEGRAKQDLLPRVCESWARPRQKAPSGHTCFRHARPANAHDTGTACGRAHRAPFPECVRWLTDKSTHPCKRAESRDALVAVTAARRGLVYPQCQNTRSRPSDNFGHSNFVRRSCANTRLDVGKANLQLIANEENQDCAECGKNGTGGVISMAF